MKTFKYQLTVFGKTWGGSESDYVYNLTPFDYIKFQKAVSEGRGDTAAKRIAGDFESLLHWEVVEETRETTYRVVSQMTTEVEL